MVEEEVGGGDLNNFLIFFILLPTTVETLIAQRLSHPNVLSFSPSFYFFSTSFIHCGEFGSPYLAEGTVGFLGKGTVGDLGKGTVGDPGKGTVGDLGKGTVGDLGKGTVGDLAR